MSTRLPKYFFLLTLILFAICFSSCKSSSSKKESLPEWITQGLSDPYYYKGVGHVTKDKTSVGYQDRANKLALQTMSEEISVNLKSSSVLVSVEKDNVLAEEFSQIVMVRASNDIEGYERYAVYETPTDYYVGYRLSRSLYQQLVSERKAKAVKLARYYYNLAVDQEGAHQYVEAVLNYTRSLDAIKGYMNELITVSDSDTRNIIKESYSSAVAILEGIQLEPLRHDFQGKYGVSLFSPLCMVTYKSYPVSGMPISVNYSDIGMSLGNIFSDAQGEVSLQIDKIRSKNVTETISASLDVEQLLNKTQIDYVLRKWILQHTYASISSQLTINPAVIYVTTSEQNLGMTLTNGMVKQTIQNFLKESNYQLSDKMVDADFYLVVTTNTEKVGVNNGLYTSKFVGEYQLKTADGKVLLKKSLLPVLGTQLNYKSAGEKAYLEAVKQLRSRMIYDIESAIIQL